MPAATGWEALRAWPHIRPRSHCAMYTSALRQNGPERPMTLDAIRPASSIWHTWYMHANRKPSPYRPCTTTGRGLFECFSLCRIDWRQSACRVSILSGGQNISEQFVGTTTHHFRGPYQVRRILLPREEPQHWHARQHGEQRQTVRKDVVHIGVVEAIWHRED